MYVVIIDYYLSWMYLNPKYTYFVTTDCVNKIAIQNILDWCYSWLRTKIKTFVSKENFPLISTIINCMIVKTSL